MFFYPYEVMWKQPLIFPGDDPNAKPKFHWLGHVFCRKFGGDGFTNMLGAFHPTFCDDCETHSLMWGLFAIEGLNSNAYQCAHDKCFNTYIQLKDGAWAFEQYPDYNFLAYPYTDFGAAKIS